ncbi:MAG: hypothetical protein HY904_18895 [Deltaproteobacteria bacterium]|nr:hypothetical protein [Deltaproteobacteria bacterium]
MTGPRENPFYLLELPPECTRADVERQGQKLLGMLELGLPGAATHPTPAGARPRDADGVRWAMAELRDPARRLAHEATAQLPARMDPGSTTTPPSGEPRGPAGVPGLLMAAGWGRAP